MTIAEFKKKLSSTNLLNIVEEHLFGNSVYVIPNSDEYSNYLSKIAHDYTQAKHIAIMGSGNWCYSLNPEKSFRTFNDKSDIDIAIVCEESFHETWEELRDYHRKNFYLLNLDNRNKLRRNGENVYSGFISPKWISDKKSKIRFNYEVRTNTYSSKAVGYRTVNMMYFKNIAETIDYYVRGFRLAKNRI